MHENVSWSISLGRWGGVRLRLHLAFVLTVVLVLLLCSLRPAGGADVWRATVGLAVLLLSVLWHELGHGYAVARVGGAFDHSVLMPWGGLNGPLGRKEVQSAVLVHLAGPAANLLICAICTPMLLAADASNFLFLLHPLGSPHLAAGSALMQIAKLTFWINWLLVLINLVPAFPFDGGRALRAGLSRLWWRSGEIHAVLAVGRAARVAAVGLIVVAWLVRDVHSVWLLPEWFALSLLAIVLLFGASQERVPQIGHERPAEDHPFGYDFSEGYTSLERSSESLDGERAEEEHGPVSQWLEQKRRLRERRAREVEAEDERRVDEILARLHQLGMESLSGEDRAVLERVSARYRNRLGDRA